MDAYAKPELDSPDLHPSFSYPEKRSPVAFTHKRFALLAGRMARAFASLTAPHLTPARVDVLLRLMDGPILQRDLCLEIGVVPSVLSRILDALERLGYVTRVKWKKDRRFRQVSLVDGAAAVLFPLFDGFIADESLSCGIQAEAEALLADAWGKHFAREGISGTMPFEGDKRDFLRRMTHAERQTRYVDQWFDVALRPDDMLVPPTKEAADDADDLARAWRWMQRRWRKFRENARTDAYWCDLRKTRSASPEALAPRRIGLAHDSTKPPSIFRRYPNARSQWAAASAAQ